MAEARKRAPRTTGPRTTLRLSPAVADAAERLARELGISRNDAVLRLASRGAQIYDEANAIEKVRAARWAAVVAKDVDRARLPSPEEARTAALFLRDIS